MKKIFLALGILLVSSTVFASHQACNCYTTPQTGSQVFNTCEDSYHVQHEDWLCGTDEDIAAAPPGATIFQEAIGWNTSCDSISSAGICPTVAPFCAGASCPIQLSKTFDFDVQMGGVKADLYVCEVGFNVLCPTCTQHYLTLDDSTTPITDHQVFTQADAPSKAKVYINDLFFGAEFYVKYCLKAKRLVVGSEAALPFAAVITPSVTIWTGLYQGVGANDYATISQLGANVYEDCESATGPVEGNSTQGTLLTTEGFAFSSESTTAVTYPTTTLEYCGDTECEKKQCVWTIKFNEQATCYRPMKCEVVDGVSVCKPYESTIHTKFDAAVDFNCDEGTCAE